MRALHVSISTASSWLEGRILPFDIRSLAGGGDMVRRAGETVSKERARSHLFGFTHRATCRRAYMPERWVNELELRTVDAIRQLMQPSARRWSVTGDCSCGLREGCEQDGGQDELILGDRKGCVTARKQSMTIAK